MVELRDRRLLIDGRPTLVFAGEIHYFRLRKDEWEDRVMKLKGLGCNTVASYIPWIVHEEVQGQIDVRDVAEFIDLCQRHGLWFVARPGPFVMAEMKNEGIPFWVYTKHPDAIPVSFKGEKATTKTLDYLHPGYLDAAERWYGAVMPLIAERLQTRGGPVIGVQLDNEVGMLQWVSNQPDLSDDTLCDLAKWIGAKYGHDRYPFDLNDPATRAEAMRNPKPDYAPRLLRDYGDYERNRFARYIAKLRAFAEANGVTGVPFIVNIHGSGGGRGTEFPIGIHQLYESYTQAAGYWAGSDHYLGELTRDNAPDLYYLNAFMAAVNRPEQPLSSMEFEVGTGDYGETAANRMSGAAADFKTRLSVAQGNRLINYYLLAGGRNPLLKHPPGDGNNRVSFTGERHGFAAPINPEGELDPTYFALKDTTKVMMAVADKIADMEEEYDDLALAFLPDYYKTDLHLDGPMQEIVENLRSAREPLGSITRAMLFLGYRFPAVDIQDREPDPGKALVFASARNLDEWVQRKLARYVEAGGRLLLFGALPTFDMEARTCLVLADALGWTPAGTVDGSQIPSMAGKGEDWASFEPEVGTWQVHTVTDPGKGVFMRIVSTKAPCGVEASVGRGKAIYLGVNYPFHPRFYRALFTRLGVQPKIGLEAPNEGVLVTTMSNREGERFVTLINLDLETKRVRLGGSLEMEVTLAGKTAKLLPFNMRFGNLLVQSSTTEVLEVEPGRLAFRQTGRPETILVVADKVDVVGANHQQDNRTHILTTKPDADTIEVHG